MWFGCAYPDYPGSLNFNIVFRLLVVLDMMHPNMFPNSIVSVDVKKVEVKHEVKLDEVNDDVKLDEVNDDVKPGCSTSCCRGRHSCIIYK